MSFNNGYPDEQSIKLPLYTVEPEQISDLVAVQFSKNPPWKVQLTTGGVSPSHQSDRDIQDISFPLSYSPCLFQRYNPTGLPFADGYSTKLYQWRNKYSQSLLLDHVSYLKPRKNEIQADLITVDFNVGKKVKIVLPDTLEKITFSYYYPELNREDAYLPGNGFQGITIPPEQIKDWRTINLPGDIKPRTRKGIYEFQRIKNDCITCPVVRAWLIRFETHFCKGQEIEIDEDFLIASLVFDYGTLTQENIDFIKNQIPECYFYDYLDTFFRELDLAIVNSLGGDFKVKQPTTVTWKFDVKYDIFHRMNSTESVRKTRYEFYNRQLWRDVDSIEYTLNADNLYRLGGSCPYTADYEYGNYVEISNILKFGAIIYANNNYWNNYSFNLQDKGRVELEIWQDGYTGRYEKTPFFKYFGFDDEFRFNFIIPNSPYGEIDSKRNYGLINDFERSPIVHSGYLQTNFLAMQNALARDSVYLWNEYFTRILYSSVSSFADFEVRLENVIQKTEYTVNNNLSRGYWGNPYFVREENLKVFQIQVTKRIFNCNYTDRLSNRMSPTKTESIDYERIILGEVDCSFRKYGESHPTARMLDKALGINSYIATPYYTGRNVENSINPPRSYYVQGNVLSQNITLPNSPGSFLDPSFPDIDLTRYNLDHPALFSAKGTKTITHTGTLEPATNLKFLPPVPGYETFVSIIKTAHETCYMALIDLEELKLQVKEIHLALDAKKFAYEDEKDDVSRVANLGYYIERIARVLGISVNSNGSIRSLRQSKRIASGDTIPNGWNLGQWGRNNGENSAGQQGGKAEDEKDGLAWEIRTNQFKNNDFTGKSNVIEQGGFALVENIPQLLHIIMSDLDRAFDLQNAGANVLPTPNGGQIASYQGMNSMLLDLLFTLGQISRQTTGTHILAMKNQAINQELLSGFGLPIAIKELEISAGKPELGVLPFPGFSPGAPTLNDLHALTLTNIGALIGSKIELPKSEEELEEQEEANKKLAEPEKEVEIEILKEKKAK